MIDALDSHCTRQFGVFTIAQALAAGYTRAEVRARLDSGRWTRLRRGVYGPTARLEAADLRAAHSAQAAAAVLALAPPAAVSHRSAVVLRNLPILGNPGAVHVTRDSTSSRLSGATIHRAPLPSADLGRVGAIPITSPMRTLLDVARAEPFRDALVVADALLYAGLVTQEQVAAQLAAPRSGPGAAALRRVLELASPLAESPGESLSRAQFLAHGVPMPELQVVLGGPAQEARVDFYWRWARLVGEFDGRLKYDTREDVYAEKLREDRIRARGDRVVRWGWTEAFHDFGPTAQQILRLLAAAA